MTRTCSLLALVLILTTLSQEQAEAAGEGVVDSPNSQAWPADLAQTLEAFPVVMPAAPTPAKQPENQRDRPEQVSFAAGLDRVMGGPSAETRGERSTQAAAR